MLISYAFFGAGTTLVNILVYMPLQRLIHYMAANVVAWVAAVLFAFFTNKAFVFENTDWSSRAMVRQMASFSAARLFSLGLEEGILWAFVEQLHLSPLITKLAAQVVVIVFNYFASRLLFRVRNEAEKE